MPILQGDIKLLKSERMTDNADGGGRITGNVIADGQSNEIFNDVSDLDRVYGRTSLRKVFGAVETDDTELYFGSHVIIDQAPDDPNVSVLAFSTGDAADQRAGARNRVESYVIAGPRHQMVLYGDQLQGQRSIRAYQLPGYTLPDIGDVLLLSTETGPHNGETQYVRITEMSHEVQTFVDDQGEFQRDVLTLGISAPLKQRFYGIEVSRKTSEAGDTLVRQTLVADASQYYGVSTLAFDAALGASQLQVDSVFQPIVPSTRAENPVVDVPVGGGVTVTVPSGGINHEIQQVAETDQITVEINNRSFNYTRNLQPLPAPRTLVVQYRALGRWYTLRDENGTGELSGPGTGQINYLTGSVIVTLQALPDTDSALIFTWGTPVHYVDRAGYAVPFATPSLKFALNFGGVVPGSITARWVSGDVEVTATDDGKGNLSGSATGTCIYGFRDTVNGDRVGEVWLEFADGQWPDANSNVIVDYEYGDADTETFNPNKDGSGFVQLQLAGAPIKPGSATFEWKVMRKDVLNQGAKDWDWGIYYDKGEYTTGKFLDDAWEERRDDSRTITYRARDDGAGGLQGFAGTVDYDTGLITLEVEKVHTVKTWNKTSENPGQDQDVAWKETSVTDTFEGGAAVIARYQPQVLASTTDSVTRIPGALNLPLLPLLQDMVVPTTLRFTFRGATYRDQDGKLYRDTGQGAGIYSGSIDYLTGNIELTDWGDTGANQIQITSLVTIYGIWTVVGASFRTPGAPVQVGGITVLANSADGQLLSGQAQFSGEITGDMVRGHIDYESGVGNVEFGEMVAESSLTPEEKAEDWYDPAQVEGGMIWRPLEVLPSTVRYNTVILTSLPLDPALLGLDPVRLPPDGRVPIFRSANVAVVHHTAKTPWPLGTVAGDSLDVGRTRLSLVHVEDADGTRLPDADVSADLDAGIVTLDSAADLTGYVEPLYAVHRVEDMVLLGDVQIDGTLTLIGQLSHDYPAEETLVSSALIAGDLQARWANLFDQQTWTGEWADTLIGDETSAEYNATTYPLTVTNRGTITERWALVFTGNTAFNLIGESVGQIGAFDINTDTAPINPNTGVPYFTLPALGWGQGWSAGNVLRFNTIGSNMPVWLARTVLQGEQQGSNFEFRLQVRGNVNA